MCVPQDCTHSLKEDLENNTPLCGSTLDMPHNPTHGGCMFSVCIGMASAPTSGAQSAYGNTKHKEQEARIAKGCEG